MQLAFGVLTAFASVALLGLMAMTCIDVAGRYFFRSPLPAAYELTTLLMAILIFAGLPVVTGVGAHLKVDLLEGVAKRFAPLRIAIAIVNGVVLLAGLILLIVALEHQSVVMIRYHTQTFYLLWPLAPFAIFMTIMTALAIFAGCYQLWRSWRGDA